MHGVVGAAVDPRTISMLHGTLHGIVGNTNKYSSPPWKYGDIGFDCSGLVAWAVCQVTGRNLFSEGLRVTHSMYCASEAKLKYKYVSGVDRGLMIVTNMVKRKYPYAQRKLGDAVFFGGACSCSNPDTIHHVGLMMYVEPLLCLLLLS